MDVLYPALLFLILGGVAIAVCNAFVPPAERRWLTTVLLASLFFRIVLASVFAAFPSSRFFHEDANGYEYFGQELARSWRGLRPPVTIITEQQRNFGWVYLCGGIYYVFGDFQPLASCFNAVVGTIVVFLVYALARQFFHTLVARRAALLTAFVPSMMLWSAVAIKDALMALLILVGLVSSVSLKRRFSIAAALGICFALVAMQPIRFYMVYFLGFAIFVSLAFERGVGLVSGVYKQVVVVGLFVALLAMAGIAGSAQAGLEAFDLQAASRFRHGMAVTANSGFDVDVDVSTPGRALLYLPYGITALLLGPFPWQYGSLRGLFAAPETIYWWLLFPSTLRGIWWMVRSRFGATSPLLLFAATLTCAYSIMHGNIGSGFRQRAQIFVVLFIFAALGLYRKRCLDKRIDPDLLLTDQQPPPAPPAVTPPRSRRARAT
jgi:hypothetical protein